jgi:hypothetical protein
MDDKTFVLLIRKYRFVMLAFALAAFAVGYLTVLFSVEHGTAQVGFKVSGMPLIRTADNTAVYQSLFNGAEQYERQRLMIMSDDMVSYLVKRFNLYKYYNTDPDGEYSYERITRQVTNRITVDKKVSDMIVVTYVDRDSRMAANILNAMMERLENLNREEAVEVIRANAEVYDRTRNDLAMTFDAKQTLLKNGLEELNRLYSMPQTPEVRRDLFNLQLSLYRQTADLAQVKNQMVGASAKYELSEASIEKEHRPIIHVFSKPIPSDGRKWMVTFGAGTTAAIAIVFVLLALLYYRERYEWVVRTILS